MSDRVMDQKLYDYLKIVKSYLIKRGASKEDAEDIVQDTAYKFILYSFSLSEKLLFWFLRVLGRVEIVVIGVYGRLKIFAGD